MENKLIPPYQKEFFEINFSQKSSFETNKSERTFTYKYELV